MGDLGWKDIRHIMISVYHLRAAQTNTQMKVVCSTHNQGQGTKANKETTCCNYKQNKVGTHM